MRPDLPRKMFPAPSRTCVGGADDLVPWQDDAAEWAMEQGGRSCLYCAHRETRRRVIRELRSASGVYLNGPNHVTNGILSPTIPRDHRQTERQPRTAFRRRLPQYCGWCLCEIGQLCDERSRTSCTIVVWSIGKRRILSRCSFGEHRQLPIGAEALGPGSGIRDEEHRISCAIGISYVGRRHRSLQLLGPICRTGS
jgi:hypothetical protein